MVDGITKDVSDIDLVGVISKVNSVGSNPNNWWIDSVVTCPMCYEKKIFSIFKPVETGEKVFKKLVSGSLLNSHGFSTWC